MSIKFKQSELAVLCLSDLKRIKKNLSSTVLTKYSIPHEPRLQTRLAAQSKLREKENNNREGHHILSSAVTLH